MSPTKTRNLNRLGMVEVRRWPAPNGRISRVVAGFLNQRQDPPTRLSQLLVYGTVASIWNSSMANSAIQKTAENSPESAIMRALGARSIVLVGMMGAGKSSVGRRLAARLALPFVDADSEIESAAGMTIPEIFDKHGEDYFRAGESRVIARLLDSGPQVLGADGGAIIFQNTRDLIHIKGISV